MAGRSKPNKNTNYLVKNVNGTTGLRCKCASWLDHWRQNSKQKRRTCAVIGCSNTAQVGAHLRSADRRTDRRWWIAPLCKRCNNSKNRKEMFLDRRVVLVSANKKLAGCA